VRPGASLFIGTRFLLGSAFYWVGPFTGWGFLLDRAFREALTDHQERLCSSRISVDLQDLLHEEVELRLPITYRDEFLIAFHQ
jgi:hypothetical protein